MATARVRVVDVSGSRATEVEAPDDVAVNRILVLLVEKLNLPLNSPDGQLMSYKLHLRRTGMQLLDTQTFAQAGVLTGDELRLQPEITAGSLDPLESVPKSIPLFEQTLRSTRPAGLTVASPTKTRPPQYLDAVTK